MNKIVEEFELYGKTYRLETGELAKMATGAVLVTQGDTQILVTAVISKQEKDYDFLSAALPSPYRLHLTTNYVGFTGGLRVIEDIYNGVLATYGSEK